MSMSSKLVASIERTWVPVVGDYYAGLIARERVRGLTVATLIYLGEALVEAGAIAVAVGLREVVIVVAAVATTIPIAVSLVLLERRASPSVGKRLTAALWSANVPVIGTMPSTRVGWASAWMHANRITPEEVARTAELVADAKPDRIPPRTIRSSVPIALVGAVLAAAGLGIQMQASAESLDSQLAASSAFVFVLTITSVAFAFSLAALCWLSLAIREGSAVSRSIATVLCASVIAVVVGLQIWTQDSVVLTDAGLVLCALSVGLAWTRSGSEYIRSATDAAKVRGAKVQARLRARSQ